MDNRSVIERAELRWRDINDTGKRLKGISPNVDPDTPPVWFDPIRFAKSQEIGRKNYGSLCIGQFIGLLLVLYFEDGLAPLAVTGNSSNVPKLFRRYLSTLIHVRNWFDYDPFDKNSKSYKSLKHVRGLHRTVSESMNEKGGRVEGRDNVFIGQFGMCYAQFSFTGFIALFPKECGLHSLTEEEMDSLLYFWKVIGYCLGTDDRFNLCSGTAQETIELCKLIFWRDWHPLVNSQVVACPAGEDMAKGICLSMNELAKFINWNVFMKYWYPILKINKTVELKTFSEYFWYNFLYFWLNYCMRWSLCRKITTKMVAIDMAIAKRFKLYKYEKLKKNYPDLTFGNKSCPFDVNFNYIDAFEANNL